MISFFKQLKSYLVDLLFPPLCLGCRVDGEWLCQACKNQIGLLTEQICPVCKKVKIYGKICGDCKKNFCLDRLTSVFSYDDQLVKKIIKTYKYRFLKELAATLADFLYEKWMADWKNYRPVIITFVPLHKSRERWRGFNQAEILAKKLADKLPQAVFKNLLVRHSPTEPQANLHRRERLNNVLKAFSINEKAFTEIGEKPVVIIDDVISTGATLNACGRVLKEAGVKEVWGVTVARKN